MAINRDHITEIERLYEIGRKVNISVRRTPKRVGFRSLALLDSNYMGSSATSVTDDLLREFALGLEDINGKASESKSYYSSNISFITKASGKLSDVQFSPAFVSEVASKNGWVQNKRAFAKEAKKDYVRSLFQKHNFDINGSELALRIATMRDAGIVAEDGKIDKERAEAYVISFIAYKFAGNEVVNKKLVKMADKPVHSANLLIFAFTHICAELGEINYAAMVEKMSDYGMYLIPTANSGMLLYLDYKPLHHGIADFFNKEVPNKGVPALTQAAKSIFPKGDNKPSGKANFSMKAIKPHVDRFWLDRHLKSKSDNRVFVARFVNEAASAEILSH